MLNCHSGPVAKPLTDIQAHAAFSLFTFVYYPCPFFSLAESINRNTFIRHFPVNKPGFRKKKKKQSKEASLNFLIKRQLAKCSSKLWLGLLGLIDLTLETTILGRCSFVLFHLILLFTPPLFPCFRRFRTFALFVISTGKSSKGTSEGVWEVWRLIKNSRSYR